MSSITFLTATFAPPDTPEKRERARAMLCEHAKGKGLLPAGDLVPQELEVAIGATWSGPMHLAPVRIAYMQRFVNGN